LARKKIKKERVREEEERDSHPNPVIEINVHLNEVLTLLIYLNT
jgi:hypothetical protein